MAIAPYADAFEPFGDTVWLNCAHQGPLPIAAGSATMEAVERKKSPQQPTSARFREVPARLRRAIAALINSEPERERFLNVTFTLRMCGAGMLAGHVLDEITRDHRNIQARRGASRTQS